MAFPLIFMFMLSTFGCLSLPMVIYASLENGQELTESNASLWLVQASDNAYCQLFDDINFVKVGRSSIKLITGSGYDVEISYPATRNADWDLSGLDYVGVWFYAQNPNIGFQSNSPSIRLCTNSGYCQYQMGDILNAANGTWKYFYIPLDGDNLWQRSCVGNISLSHIDWIEIHVDTWDFGFTLWIDGLEFRRHKWQIWPIFEPVVGGKYQLHIKDELQDGSNIIAENPEWETEPRSTVSP